MRFGWKKLFALDRNFDGVVRIKQLEAMIKREIGNIVVRVQISTA